MKYVIPIILALCVSDAAWAKGGAAKFKQLEERMNAINKGKKKKGSLNCF